MVEALLELRRPAGELALDALGHRARAEDLRELAARAARGELLRGREVARLQPAEEALVRRALERDEFVVEPLTEPGLEVARADGALPLERRRARAQDRVPRGGETARLALDAARDGVERILLERCVGDAVARALRRRTEEEPRERADRDDARDGRSDDERARTAVARERIDRAGHDLGRAALAQTLEVRGELRRRRVAPSAVARQALAQDEHHPGESSGANRRGSCTRA